MGPGLGAGSLERPDGEQRWRSLFITQKLTRRGSCLMTSASPGSNRVVTCQEGARLRLGCGGTGQWEAHTCVAAPGTPLGGPPQQ